MFQHPLKIVKVGRFDFTVFCLCLCVILPFFVLFLLDDKYEKALKEIDCKAITVYDAEVINTLGFHGDGEYSIVFRNLHPDQISEAINRSDRWEFYTKDALYSMFLYGAEIDGAFYGPLIKDTEIPDIEKGYVFFTDRQNPKAQYTDDDLISVYKRHSHNIIIAFIDLQANCLYYIKSNT